MKSDNALELWSNRIFLQNKLIKEVWTEMVVHVTYFAVQPFEPIAAIRQFL